MSYLKTLLVNGTDLRTLTGVRVLHMDLYAPGTRRGATETIPGARGQVVGDLPLDGYNFTVGVLLDGADVETWTANLAAVSSLLCSISTPKVTLERRLPHTGGSGYKAMTARGLFAGGLNPTMFPGLVSGQTELQFANLDGAWWDAGTSTWNL